MQLAVFLVLSLLGLSVADQSAVIKGRMIIPHTMNHSSTVLILHTSLGEQIRTFVDVDGSFAIYGVAPGVQLLQPFHISLIFPEIRLEVSRKGALVRASYSHNRHLVMQSPLIIRPVSEAQFYEKRKPFDVWSFVKSPYGLMIVVSVLAIVVFPRMKMDPEDYKELQEQMRQPADGAGSSPAALPGPRQGPARLRDK